MLKKIKYDSEIQHAIVKTIRNPVSGVYPAIYDESRLDKISKDIRPPPRIRRSKRLNNPTTRPSGSIEKTFDKEELLKSSFSINDYLNARESGMIKNCKIYNEEITRRVIMRELLRESPINIITNRVLSSKWLNDHQVIFGTKCHSVLIYDIKKRCTTSVPTIGNHYAIGLRGIYTIEKNKSGSIMGMAGRYGNELGLYALPSLEPLCIGERGHYSVLMGMVWVDDNHVVTAGRDAHLAVWDLSETHIEQAKNSKPTYKKFAVINPVTVEDCDNAENLVAICFNHNLLELAALSIKATVLIYDSRTWKKKFLRKLLCFIDIDSTIVYNDCGFYVVGCCDYMKILDSQTLEVIARINSHISSSMVRSISFHGNLMTVGTGFGVLLFYDIRTEQFLEKDKNTLLKIKCGQGFIDPEALDGIDQAVYTPAIHTHAYDSTGTRVFIGGGPLSLSVYGNYAAVWH